MEYREGSSMEYYVGLDVHSKVCSFVIQTAGGTVVGQGEIPTTAAGFQQLVRDHGLPRGTPVALETGTVAFFVARELTALGLVPSVIDASEVRLKAYRPRQKSDRRDTHELCEGLRRGIYRTCVHVPPLPVARLREPLSRRRHFVRLQTAEVNAVKRLLRGTGRGLLSRSLGTEVGWAKLFAFDSPRVPFSIWVVRGGFVRPVSFRLPERNFTPVPPGRS